jgi:SAM-dependent methyltransferase
LKRKYFDFLTNIVYGIFPERKKNKKAAKFLQEVYNYVIFLEHFQEKIKDQSYNLSLQVILNEKTKRLCFVFVGFLDNLPLKYQKDIEDAFRLLVQNYIYKSKLLSRFYRKPQGYPGDYLMFELLYDNKPISKGLGYYFDNLILGYPFTKSIISRKNYMTAILKKEIFDSLNNQTILNIGSGSCREIKELLPLGIDKKVEFHCLDQDQDSLVYAKSLLANRFSNITMSFTHQKALSLFGYNRLSNNFQLGRYDIIYSMGVVDYFLDNVLSRFLRNYYALVASRGKLILAFCGANYFEYYPIKLFCDWLFYNRNYKDVVKLVKDTLGVKPVILQPEGNNSIFFVIVGKK